METDHADTAISKPVMKIAVRMLSETVFRHGGLAGNSLNSEAAEGIKLHQLYFTSMLEKYGNRILTEQSLTAEYQTEEFLLRISGRCDMIVIGNNQAADNLSETDRYQTSLDTIAEIKSHALKPNQLPAGGDNLHWAQLMLYGWLYVSNGGKKPSHIQLELIYLSIEDRSRQFWRRIVAYRELEQFFLTTCEKYLKTAGNWLTWQKLRNTSSREITFPYVSVRPGQKELMNEILAAIRQNGILFAQAPTGIGKTMSALFPAVRALGHQLTDYVFYLTAMTSTRQVAVNALNEMREKGLHLRSIVLYAKEKICLQPDMYCDTANCPYAVMYYTNLPDAIASLLHLEEIDLDAIISCARKYQLCPFELSLDISLYCDVIICDYNYAFDPRVKLDRFFGQQPRSSLLLIDEAHNLPARSREMYSAVFEERLLIDAISSIEKLKPETNKQLTYLSKGFKQMQDWFNLLRPHITSAQPEAGFELAERNCREPDTMKAPNFLGMRKKPDQLLSIIGRCRYFLRTFLEDASDLPDKKVYQDLMFQLSFFSRISELFDRGFHITTLEKLDNESQLLKLSLRCLDAADFLTETYYLKRPAVFFSATLSPMSYYIGLMDSQSIDNPPEQLILPSPFPIENFLLLVKTGLSLKFKDRDSTMSELLDLVLAVVRQKTGNYLLFVPSYAYLKKLRKLLRINKPSDIDCLLQIPNMDENLKNKYLQRFNQHGQRTLLAIAVMGSFFNEGIDLAGDKLSGVIIAGTGMPMISPEREILRQYYDNSIGSGYAYSYIYPGFNRVQQAAGRVIRSENDRGFVLLIDDRYEQYEYRQLFPNEWQPLYFEEDEEICDTISEFWLDV
ncbi:MAG: ATP-dependent DNA helicase [Eubacteriales bacterium]|nr:ATP-dependent DNA helicase [Eubacteriales bacterium]